MAEDANFVKLNIHYWNGTISEVEFPEIGRKRRNVNCKHVHVNYSGYEKYLRKEYPDLYTLDSELSEDTNYLPNKYKDSILQNPLDIEVLGKSNSPDDIMDSLSKSVYKFNFLGKYARIATKLEHGRNYVFTFTEFSLVYPFLKNYTGDATSVFNINNQGIDNEFRRYLNYKFYSAKSKATANKSRDYILQFRCNMNKSYIYPHDPMKLPGIEWCYLNVNDVDDENIKLTNIEYREKYDAFETDEIHSNKRYVFEKYLFCTSTSCPGSVKILLDCVHDIIIIKLITQHYNCRESQKRKIYDIVRKLFVVHKGDLDFIDKKYLFIPRRYGSTYVESYLSSSEIKNFYEADHMPSFFSYVSDQNGISSEEHSTYKSWTSSKVRNLENIIFNDYNTKRQKVEASDNDADNDVEQNKNRAIRERDLEMYKIADWKLDFMRMNKFNNVIHRDEWEFTIPENRENLIREIYRIWRFQYFGLTDYTRRFLCYVPLYRSLPVLNYYLTVVNLRDKVHIEDVDYNDGLISYTGELDCHLASSSESRKKHLETKYITSLCVYSKAFMQNNIYFAEEFFKLQQRPYRCALWNYQNFIPPHPVHDLMDQNEFNAFERDIYEGRINVQHQWEMTNNYIVVCDSLHEMMESDCIFFCERDISLKDIYEEEVHFFEKYPEKQTPDHYYGSLRDVLWSLQLEDPNITNSRCWEHCFPDYRGKPFSEDNRFFSQYNTRFGGSTTHDHVIEKPPFLRSKLETGQELIKLELKYGIADENTDLKTGFIICYKELVSCCIFDLIKKRQFSNPLSIVMVNYFSDFEVHFNEAQKNELSAKSKSYTVFDLMDGLGKKYNRKLNNSIEFELLLFLKYSIISKDFEIETMSNILRKKLPKQRFKDLEKYEVNLGLKKRCSIAGTARIFIKQFLELLEFLKQNELEWRQDNGEQQFSSGADTQFIGTIHDTETGEFDNEELLGWLKEIRSSLLKKREVVINSEFSKLFKQGSDAFIRDHDDAGFLRLFESVNRDVIELISNMKKSV